MDQASRIVNRTEIYNRRQTFIDFDLFQWVFHFHSCCSLSCLDDVLSDFHSFRFATQLNLIKYFYCVRMEISFIWHRGKKLTWLISDFSHFHTWIHFLTYSSNFQSHLNHFQCEEDVLQHRWLMRTFTNILILTFDWNFIIILYTNITHKLLFMFTHKIE
jgi:hypothetical protein